MTEEAEPITHAEALVLAKAQMLTRAYERADLSDPASMHQLFFRLGDLVRGVNNMISQREEE